MTEEIKCEKRIHLGYKEWEKAKKKGFKMEQYFGKYQYIYSSKKGEISLIYLKHHYHCYEIWCLKGHLLEDVERFATKKEAEKEIKELLK